MNEEFSNVVYENPEVSALIKDLGLIPKNSPEYRNFIGACSRSRYSRYLFCQRYNDWLKLQARYRSILCCELYRSYRKGSHFLPSSDVNVSGLLKLF